MRKEERESDKVGEKTGQDDEGGMRVWLSGEGEQTVLGKETFCFVLFVMHFCFIFYFVCFVL